jgi:hypothetical protein
LYRTKAHQIDERSYESSSLRDAIPETGEHPLFKIRAGFFLSEPFFKNFVHGFDFLVSFSAGSAINEMRVQLVLFFMREFAVEIGSEPVVDFVVNGCHGFNPLKRERAEALCA